jgi:hypothetical protein
MTLHEYILEGFETRSMRVSQENSHLSPFNKQLMYINLDDIAKLGTYKNIGKKTMQYVKEALPNINILLANRKMAIKLKKSVKNKKSY